MSWATAIGKTIGRRTGTTDLLRAAWELRPGDRAQRRFQRWLAERDQADDARMALIAAAVLGRTSCCVDVGAAGGDFLALVSRLAPEGHHIAYEPLPESFAALSRRFPGADLRNAAVSDEEGEVGFVEVANAPGWSGLRAYDVQIPESPVLKSIKVRSVRLDDDLPPAFQPTLVKIDVNGAEGSTLRGAQRTLRTHRPVVLLEHGVAATAYGTSSAEVWDLLEGAGLRVYGLDADGPLTRSQFTAAAATRWNFLARP